MSVVEVRAYGAIVVCGGGCYGGYYVRQLARALAAGALTVERILVVDQDPTCTVAQLAAAITRRDRTAIAKYAWAMNRPETSAIDAPSTSPATTSGSAIDERTVDAYLALPITIVLESWERFFEHWFEAAIAAPAAALHDAVVPSPLMPNLLASWVASRLERHRPSRVVTRVAMPVAPITPWSREGADGSHYASFATWMCPINCIEPPRCPETRGPRSWTMPAAVVAAVDAARSIGTPYDVVAIFRTTHRVFGVGMFDVSDALETEQAVKASSSQDSVRALVASVSHCHGALAALES